MKHKTTYERNHNCTEVEHRKLTTERWVNCRPDSKSEHWLSWKTLMYRDDHMHKKLENTKRLENEVHIYLISHDIMYTQIVRYVDKHLIGKTITWNMRCNIGTLQIWLHNWFLEWSRQNNSGL